MSRYCRQVRVAHVVAVHWACHPAAIGPELTVPGCQACAAGQHPGTCGGVCGVHLQGKTPEAGWVLVGGELRVESVCCWYERAGGLCVQVVRQRVEMCFVYVIVNIIFLQVVAMVHNLCRPAPP